jgi:hypothetical protein
MPVHANAKPESRPTGALEEREAFANPVAALSPERATLDDIPDTHQTSLVANGDDRGRANLTTRLQAADEPRAAMLPCSAKLVFHLGVGSVRSTGSRGGSGQRFRVESPRDAQSPARAL